MDLKCRYFNELHMSGFNVEKTSKEESLLDEILYYKHIPSKFKKYFVNFDHAVINKLGYKLVLQKYISCNLSTLYINDTKSVSFWSDVFGKLVGIIKDFSTDISNSSMIDLNNMYCSKLNTRTLEYFQSTNFKSFFTTKDININGKWYPPAHIIVDKLVKYIKDNLLNIKSFSYIHGDLCFSNILVNTNNGIKLVDPRGRFGNTVNNFGDIRYDIAKLYHSVFGLYDFIIQQRYILKHRSVNKFEFTFNAHGGVKQIQALFKYKFSGMYDYTTIRILESMLFLSMLPLHREDEFRQCALLLNGISILSEVGVI